MKRYLSPFLTHSDEWIEYEEPAQDEDFPRTFTLHFPKNKKSSGVKIGRETADAIPDELLIGMVLCRIESIQDCGKRKKDYDRVIAYLEDALILMNRTPIDKL